MSYFVEKLSTLSNGGIRMNQKTRTTRIRHDGELGRINDRGGFAVHGSCFNSFLTCLNARIKNDDYRSSIPSRLNKRLRRSYPDQIAGRNAVYEQSSNQSRH